MRIRPIAALSVTAAAVLLLAGCAGGSDPEATATPTAAADLCSAAAPSGAQSEAVTVEGEPGATPTASFEAPLEISEVQRTLVSEGDGDPITTDDLVAYGLSAFDAESGEAIGSVGYTAGELLPSAVSAESVLGQFLGCATIGSRVVTTLPADSTSGSPAAVYVIDVLSTVPTAAWGEEQAPVDGMPTVELGEDGEPTVTIPDAEAPAELQLATLKLGDGAVVQPGETVLVQYKGLLWSDGSEFDSSWSRGTPSSFATTGVVDGFRQALEGQTVGSQVLVVIPPALGYGDQEQDGIPAGSTLVFVVDILATQAPAAQ